MAERSRKPNWSSGCFSKFRAYDRSARKRNLPFELTLGEFIALTARTCTYCDALPSAVHYAGNGKTGNAFVYNGIDRVDSDKGYVEGNVVACCKTCNVAKSNTSLAEFLAWVDRVHKFSITKETSHETHHRIAA